MCLIHCENKATRQHCFEQIHSAEICMDAIWCRIIVIGDL